MTSALALAFGYMLGSIPFGIVMAKLFGLGDLRQIGSGNIGATNVLRTGSKKAAALTLILDALKGFVAVATAGATLGPVPAAFAGLGAFIGHCFPVWLNFRGGKGVATFLGVFAGLHWPTFLMLCAVWLIVALVSRYSSLSAIVAAVAAPVSLLAFNANPYALGVTVAMTALLIFRHHENIGRLLRGEESKISFGSK